MSTGNLIYNGSFETHGTLNRGSWGTFSHLAGWRALNGEQIEVQSHSVVGVGSAHGNAHLELDRHNAGNSGVYQDVPVMSGDSYVLKFSYSPRVELAGTKANDIEVWWDGQLLAVISGDQQGWQDYEFTVTGGGGTGTRLMFKSAGDGGMGGLIDNVSLESDSDGSNDIVGGAGNDEIYGNADNQNIDGKGGDDTIYGNGGADTINGGAGNDTLSGGDGTDVVNGGDGDDTLYGNNGGDVVTGGAGNDTLYGGAGADVVTGDAGNDTLDGGAGNDVITGGAGDDVINGGAGNDGLTGGAGNDEFIFSNGDGSDTINDFQDNSDRVDLSNYTQSDGSKITFNDLSITQSGADMKITGLDAGDEILIRNELHTNITADDFIFG